MVWAIKVGPLQSCVTELVIELVIELMPSARTLSDKQLPFAGVELIPVFINTWFAFLFLEIIEGITKLVTVILVTVILVTVILVTVILLW